MKSVKCGGGYIHEIQIQNIEYIGCFYGAGGNEDIKKAYERISKLRGRAPDLFFNAELFEFATRKPASDIVVGGVVHRLTEGYGIAFPDNKTAVLSYKNNVKAKDYIGAYPVLIRNGKAEKSTPEGIGGSRGRTALGVGGGNLYVALIPDGANDVSLDTLRQEFLKVGASDAINLDGGGSTQFYSPCGNHYTGRKIRGFIGVWLKESTETNSNKEGAKMPTVFLSAGHGGTQPGAVAYGLKEKDINLNTLLGCKAALERHGVKVIASRLKDENDPVENEAKEANASGADVAVSFHANAGGGDGFEVYYYSTNEKDKKLAQLCEKHIKAIGQNSRGLKKGNSLYWCKNTKMTSCLVESFFVDNDKDNDIGDTVAEQMTIGIAYAKAILEYLGIKYVEAEKSVFSDVPADHWAAESIKTCKEKGYMSGYSDGTFKPEAPVTRAELASILDRLKLL